MVKKKGKKKDFLELLNWLAVAIGLTALAFLIFGIIRAFLGR